MGIQGKKIFIVCSDPGASQSVILLFERLESKGSSVLVIARNVGRHFACAAGIKVYGKSEAYINYKSIKKFLKQQKPSLVVTGTSSKDNLERNYIQAAKALRILVISFVDWWTNLRKRFVHTKMRRLCIPDYICVVDKFAERMCKKQFGNKAKIVISGNPYFSQIKRLQTGIDKEKTLKNLKLNQRFPTILFFAEPAEPFPGYNQFEIFKRISSQIRKVIDAHNKPFNIIIKFHPQGEKTEIYRRYANIVNEMIEKGCPVALVRKKHNIDELINVADYVWGMSTAPLLEAMIRGKLVSSFTKGFNISGIPFLKDSKFCPSAGYYREFPALIRNLLTNREFIKMALKKQKKYRISQEDLASVVLRIIKPELN